MCLDRPLKASIEVRDSFPTRSSFNISTNAEKGANQYQNEEVERSQDLDPIAGRLA